VAPAQASGCIVDERGLILSTAHFLGKDLQYWAVDAKGKRHELQLLKSDEERDLALFRAQSAVGTAADIGDASELAKGAPLLTISAPARLNFTAATGIVAGVNRSYQGRPVIQTTLPLAKGSSGGPVFDRNGRLVGLIFGRLEELEQTSLVYPINSAYGLLSAAGASAGADNAELRLPLYTADTEAKREALEYFNRAVDARALPEKERLYLEALEFDEAFYEARFNLAHAYMRQGRLERAADAYARALKLRDDGLDAWRNLGRVQLRLGRYAAAAESFSQAVRLAPRRAACFNDLGEALRRGGKLAAAEEAFARAVELDPRHAYARFNLGLTLMQQGRAEAAADAFAAYLEEDPGAADAARVRDWIASLRAKGRVGDSVGEGLEAAKPRRAGMKP
jgi:tetratricopeptide (TPR) repeat protein